MFREEHRITGASRNSKQRSINPDEISLMGPSTSEGSCKSSARCVFFRDDVSVSQSIGASERRSMISVSTPSEARVFARFSAHCRPYP